MMREFTSQELEDHKEIEREKAFAEVLLQIEIQNQKARDDFQWKLDHVVGE